MGIYKSVLKGVIELTHTEVRAFAFDPDVTDAILRMCSSAWIQVVGNVPISWTCTGENIDDNGLLLSADGGPLLIEGTSHLQGFRACASRTVGVGEKCELHFELMQ